MQYTEIRMSYTFSKPMFKQILICTYIFNNHILINKLDCGGGFLT